MAPCHPWPMTPFESLCPARWSRCSRGFHRLAVDHACTRLSFAPLALARLHGQVEPDRLPQPVVAPLVEILRQRHWHPVEAIYSTAFTISRRSVLRDRPIRRGDGMNGSISAHPPSIRSLAYRGQSRRYSRRAFSVPCRNHPRTRAIRSGQALRQTSKGRLAPASQKGLAALAKPLESALSGRLRTASVIVRLPGDGIDAGAGFNHTTTCSNLGLVTRFYMR